MNARHAPRNAFETWVFRTQLAVLVGFCIFAGLVIIWICRLIYVSWQLKDVFSASIGIALVAVPIFLFLSIIVNYVFWGLYRGSNEERKPSA